MVHSSDESKITGPEIEEDNILKRLVIHILIFLMGGQKEMDKYYRSVLDYLHFY